MQKLITRGKITEYDLRTGRFAGFIDTADRGYMKALADFIDKKQWRFEFSKYYKARSTGEFSQNHHYRGHLQQLCVHLGDSMGFLDRTVRQGAISWGYPFDIIDGQTIAWEESREGLDSRQMSILIDYLHWWGSDEHQFIFYEGAREPESGKDDKSSADSDPELPREDDAYDRAVQRFMSDSEK